MTVTVLTNQTQSRHCGRQELSIIAHVTVGASSHYNLPKLMNKNRL